MVAVKVENKNVWKIPFSEIESRNYNLDLKNPNGNSKTEHVAPESILEEIIDKENKIEVILRKIREKI